MTLEATCYKRMRQAQEQYLERARIHNDQASDQVRGVRRSTDGYCHVQR